jgi:hypothetical protein
MERTEHLEQKTANGFSVGYHGVCLLLSGLSIGALLMYLFDPDRGRGRRAKLSDQFASKINHLEEAAEGRARDLRNRAKGVIHDVSAMLPGTGRGSERNQSPTSQPT